MQMSFRQRLVFAALMSGMISALMVACALLLSGTPLGQIPGKWIRVWPVMYPVAFTIVVVVAPPLTRWVMRVVK